MASQLPRRTIVFVPFAAQGHVGPMLQLARALADRGDISVIVAVPDFIHRRMGQYRSDDGTGVVLVPLPSGVQDDGGDEPPGAAVIVHAMEHRMPSQLDCMLSTMQGVSCIVVDLLSSWAIPVAARWGLPVVGFWVGMMATYRSVTVIPELIKTGFVTGSGTLLSTDVNGEDNFIKHHHDLGVGDLHILPAKLKLRARDLPWLVNGAVSQKTRFAFWLQLVKRAKSLRSIIINSFPGEDGVDSDGYDPPQGQQFLHVGPVLLNEDLKKKTSLWQADQTCIDWLDTQSPGSVIYVSFGSWAAPIGPDKITGFARGLEASGRPFLWALKNHPSWRAGLPDGYIENVAGRGKIVSWAPQDDVLKHEAVGCYLMHSGWNSVMEALRHGVRMICYPICGDHFVNCAYVVNMWKAGIALPSSDERDVKDCVKRVMEGEEGRRLQEKVNELKEVITGEAMCVARRNINLFMEETIKNDEADDSIEIGQETKL
ncbi:hypothetical protein QOZ80_1BG0064270 [Eleusine coracana subsp. coracana]|nr:hypothetical protein QOZ80_1BG0064270 [Eleusine coracana subsp. coracana]